MCSARQIRHTIRVSCVKYQFNTFYSFKHRRILSKQDNRFVCCLRFSEDALFVLIVQSYTESYTYMSWRFRYDSRVPWSLHPESIVYGSCWGFGLWQPHQTGTGIFCGGSHFLQEEVQLILITMYPVYNIHTATTFKISGPAEKKKKGKSKSKKKPKKKDKKSKKKGGIGRKKDFFQKDREKKW